MSKLSVAVTFLVALSIASPATNHAEEYSVIEETISNKDYKQASSLITETLKESPEASELYYLMAQVHMNTNELDKAEDSIEQALKFNKTNEDIWLLASGIYGSQAQASSIFSKLGYAKKAKKSLSKALAINPKSSDALAGLVQFHLAAPGIAGGDKDAIPDLLSQLIKVDTTMGTIIKAQLSFTDEKNKQGYEILDGGIKSNPSSIGIRFAKGMKLQSDKQFQESFDELSKASSIPLTEQSSDQEKEWSELALYQSAKISAETGIELQQGKTNMNAFMELDQTTVSEAWIRFRFGQILWQLNEKDFAKAQFDLIPSLNPDKRLKELKKDYLENITL